MLNILTDDLGYFGRKEKTLMLTLDVLMEWRKLAYLRQAPICFLVYNWLIYHLFCGNIKYKSSRCTVIIVECANTKKEYGETMCINYIAGSILYSLKVIIWRNKYRKYYPNLHDMICLHNQYRYHNIFSTLPSSWSIYMHLACYIYN